MRLLAQAVQNFRHNLAQPLMDVRLRTVAGMIESQTHVDVGSDHASLLVSLLRKGSVRQGIAIENKRTPYENSRRALAGLTADVRFGDGLEPLAPGEGDSLSICGMGAESLVRILSAHPDRCPTRLVLQPNRQPDLVRRWAFESGYHLTEESIAWGHWPYHVLSYRAGDGTHDPAYRDLDLDSAWLFGPIMIRRRDPNLARQLEQERTYYSKFDRLDEGNTRRLTAIERALADQPSLKT